jgi:hypothetical protein
MVNTELTLIEEKKKNLKDGNSNGDSNTNNWLNFGLWIIFSLLIVLGVGVIGANLIYMTTAKNKFYDVAKVTLLEKLLPTEEAQYFPQKGGAIKGGAMKGGAMCSSSVDPAPNWSNLNNIGIGKSGGWPYSMYKEGRLNGVFQGFKNWFAESVADSYITSRSLLQKWLNLFAPVEVDKNIFSNETFQIFFLAPLMLLIFPLVVIFIYFSNWVSAFKTSWIYTIFGMIFVYSWFTTFFVVIIQAMQYLLTLLFLPLFADYKRIKKIINCNITSLSLLFGLLMCISAFQNLDTTIAITMLIVYLMMVVKTLFSMFKS